MKYISKLLSIIFSYNGSNTATIKFCILCNLTCEHVHVRTHTRAHTQSTKKIKPPLCNKVIYLCYKMPKYDWNCSWENQI